MNTKRDFSSNGNSLHQEINKIEENRGWWFLGKKYIITQTISRYISAKKSAKILDVGCGTGFILKGLTKLGDVYGIDINQKAVKICHKQGLRNVKKGDILKIPFRNNVFDVVIMADIIEHIKNDKKAIIEGIRVLKKGGILIINTPSSKIPWSKLDDQFGHVRRYDKKRLADILSNKHLRLIKLSYINFFLYYPILIIRMIQNKTSKDFIFDSTGMKILPSPIEFIFRILFMSEVYILRLINLPIGVSLFAIVRKTH